MDLFIVILEDIKTLSCAANIMNTGQTVWLSCPGWLDSVLGVILTYLELVLSFPASEVALNKKRNGSESLPIKVRSFAKKMDDSSEFNLIKN